ncbi:mediator of RNA polymerase II transcription subunit 26-like [Onthophagus taurus]|uniref:mediator of RNA polymerase II transcription subunit 26-like n=1 Tax=Onthophagus taurus TaxID=166361 RepID=UPI0039BDF908
MQQDAGELSQKLLRSLDDVYNVIDMPAVLEVISVLEKISISKEILQSSRLGKYVNEVRRNTTDDQLAKRTRDLVKRWRNEFIAESNGQLKAASETSTSSTPQKRPQNLLTTSSSSSAKDNQVLNAAKRPRLNGNNELDLSDNSNSSFKDEIIRKDLRDNIILVNSDSNSSVTDVVKKEPVIEEQLPKKRGRKKGSKNHKSLLDEAETSFSNKMAVSRGNAKVKTTQELVASLQNRNNVSLVTGLKSPTSGSGRFKEDLNEKAAKLTERVSIIDQKLYNTNANNFRRKKKSFETIKEEIEIKKENDEEVIIVDEDDVKVKIKSEENQQSESTDLLLTNSNIPRALSIEEALNSLPPIDKSFLESKNLTSSPHCTCVFDEDTSAFIEDASCPSKIALNDKYDLNNVSDEKVDRFLSCSVPNLNGNESLGPGLGPPETTDDGFYKNVVPNRVLERMPKIHKSDDDLSDDIKRYRISEDCEKDSFREWHEVVEARSYDGEVIRILPYVVID